MNNWTQKVFLLGGNDAEMTHIKETLDVNNIPYLDKGLGWGAKVEDYAEEIAQLVAEGKQPVAIELAGAGEGEYAHVMSIDHHGNRAQEKASIMQVLEMIDVAPSLKDELIAANDSGYIPAMQQLLATKGINDTKEQQKMIDMVRYMDRKAQGIMSEQEDQARDAVANKEVLLDGALVVVMLPHSKSATVTDRLFGTYTNLLILSGDGEVNFFGDGALCKELGDAFPGGRNGGSGLGIKGGNAYWWGYPNHDAVKAYVIEKI